MLMGNNQLPVDPYIQQLDQHDIDQFAEAVNQWNLDFRQLERGRIECGLTQIIKPDFNFIRIKLNRIVDQQGGSAPDSHSFLSITDPSGWVEWCGQQVQENSLIYHGPNCNFETLTNQAWCAYITTVSDTRLQQVAASLGYPEAPGLLNDSVPIKPADGSRVLSLRQLQNLYLNSIDDRALSTISLARYQQSLEQLVCEEIIRIIMDGQSSYTNTSFQGRALALKEAIGYIRDNAREAVSVADIAQVSGVSSRTLDRAFKEGLGVSPKHCIKAIRLEGVRKELKRGDENNSVTDIANEWGFWHMGDFARDYHREYGELPSTTFRSERIL
jgi:AraC family ethanolamine operon transcriptional activator